MHKVRFIFTLSLLLAVKFCFGQVHNEHKNIFTINSYNYNTTNDGLLLNDVKIILKTRNHETSSNDGNKITVLYNVISNVDIRYKTDSYRYKGKIYKLSDIGLSGYKPAVKHRVFTNYGNNWEGSNAPFGYAGLDALKYPNQSNMDVPYDITLMKITKTYITDSRNANIEAQIESYLKKKEREKKAEEVKKPIETTPRKKKGIRNVTNDDFWSGESSDNSKISDDDFWAGEENNAKPIASSKEKEDLKVGGDVGRTGFISEDKKYRIFYKDRFNGIQNNQTKKVLLKADTYIQIMPYEIGDKQLFFTLSKENDSRGSTCNCTSLVNSDLNQVLDYSFYSFRHLNIGLFTKIVKSKYRQGSTGIRGDNEEIDYGNGIYVVHTYIGSRDMRDTGFKSGKTKILLFDAKIYDKDFNVIKEYQHEVSEYYHLHLWKNKQY